MSTIIQSFEAKELKKRSYLVRVADNLTTFFGSFWFLIFNVIFFTYWLTFNTFDPFPYPLLTTIVSLEAIFLTIVVLISQQRQNQVSTIREEIDMQINRISEREITKALVILKELAKKQGINIEDKELDQMLNTLEVSYIERKLEEQLMDKSKSSIKEVVKKLSSSS